MTGENQLLIAICLLYNVFICKVEFKIIGYINNSEKSIGDNFGLTYYISANCDCDLPEHPCGDMCK